MSEHIASFLVVLKDDVSEDHAREIKKALSLFEGVIDVQPILAGEEIVPGLTSRLRERNEWVQWLIDRLKSLK